MESCSTRSLAGFAALLLATGLPVAVAEASPGPAGDDRALYPAGTINSCFGKQQTTLIFEDLPAVAAHARGVGRQFFQSAAQLTDTEALETDLSDQDLVFYGTWQSAWVQEHRDRLPFSFQGGRLELQGRSFEGHNLRVICGLRNPQNPERKLVVYVAAQPADIAGINGVYHGPTEWLVADGPRTLGAGSFDVLLSPEQMRRDLRQLTELIGSVHPACVNGLPPGVQQAAEQASLKIDSPLDRTAFTFLVNDLLLALHDAHSSAAIDLAGARLALPLRWLQEGLVISDDLGALEVGDQVLSLGGLRPDELMVGLRRLIPAENDWWIRHRAERMLQNVVVLEHLGITTEPALELRLFRDGQAITARVDLSDATPAANQPPFWVRFELDPEHSLGLFTLDRCQVNQTYQRKLHQFFEAVHEQGIERIAVDLRRNSGGNSSVCDQFLRYLDVDEFRSFSAEVRVSRASMAQNGLRGILGYFPGKSNIRQVDRVADLPPFTGELYVLTSNQTFSSGSWFSVVVQDNGLGEVLGEPTGNAPSCYGDILRFALTESGVSFTLSYKKFVRPVPERDPADSLTPDQELPVTIENLLNGTDPVLEYLRQ